VADFFRAPQSGDELYLYLDRVRDELGEWAGEHQDNPNIAQRAAELVERGQHRLRVRVLGAPDGKLDEDDVVEIDAPELTGRRGESLSVGTGCLSLLPA
jgi:hypothetical protein